MSSQSFEAQSLQDRDIAGSDEVGALMKGLVGNRPMKSRQQCKPLSGEMWQGLARRWPTLRGCQPAQLTGALERKI